MPKLKLLSDVNSRGACGQSFPSFAFIEVRLRMNLAEVRVPSGQKRRTEILFIVLQTSVQLL